MGSSLGRMRMLVAAGAAMAMFVATTGPAVAQETTVDYAAEATAAGVEISVAGLDVVDVAFTDVFVVPGEGDAYALAGALFDEPFGERMATSTAGTVVDPDGDACEVAIPSELSALISGGAACAEAEATGDVPEALAAAGVANLEAIDLTAEELDPLFDALEELGLVEILNEFVAEREAQVLSEVTGDVEVIFEETREACVQALRSLGLELVLEPLIELLEDADAEDVAGIIADIEDVLAPLPEVLPDVCGQLVDVAAILLAVLDLESVAETIEGLMAVDGLLSVGLLETVSAAWLDGDVLSAAAGPDGIISAEISVPALEEMLADLLTEALDPLVEALTEALGELAEEVENLPVVDNLVADLLASEELEALTDGPLVAVEIAPGEAFVEGNLDTLDFEGEASAALVAFGGTIFSLPVLAGLDDAINDLGGRIDETLEDWSDELAVLATLIELSFIEEDVFEDDVLGLDGLRAESGVAFLTLLPQDPILDLTVNASMAGVGIEPLDDDDDGDGGGSGDGSGGGPSLPRTDPPSEDTPSKGKLPHTGGGLGLLGLLALGGMTLLRRRR